MTKQQNIVGAQVQKIRLKKNFSQEQLAARCGVLGWNISRGTLAKVEAQIRCVSEQELFILAKALRVEMNDLFAPAFKQRFAVLYRIRR
ncbi:MAG: helix-turn-helix domain-containing protein [Verrucomicrobiales bacterium]|jgi:transcriptional regulator with XRE-family HTH domain|nr:helix-turn-helix domain-containing protein [Verrucomicrobiales bacterium]